MVDLAAGLREGIIDWFVSSIESAPSLTVLLTVGVTNLTQPGQFADEKIESGLERNCEKILVGSKYVVGFFVGCNDSSGGHVRV